MHDAAFFERWGVPAVPVVTEAFLRAAEFQARALFGAPFPIVFTIHPVVHLDREGLHRLAEEALEEIAGRLVASSPS